MIPFAMLRALRKYLRRQAKGPSHRLRLLHMDNSRWQKKRVGHARANWLTEHPGDTSGANRVAFKVFYNAGAHPLYGDLRPIELLPTHAILQQWRPPKEPPK